MKVIQDLVTSNSSLSQLIASERANNTALIKENIALRTQIQELSSQIGGQTMENKGELTSLLFTTLKPVHEKYLLMKSNKCEKSVDNVNDESNVIPNSSKNSTSREFNNVNIVTESILIHHPKGKQKTKRANKRKRRKAIATEATESKMKNVSDPQKADAKTCSSPQVTDFKATDSRSKAKPTTNKENDIMQQQQSVPNNNLKSFATSPITDEMSADPCDVGENSSGNSSNSNKNSTNNANKMKLGGKSPKRSAVILGDSIVKNIHGWKIKEKCGDNENVYVKNKGK